MSVSNESVNSLVIRLHRELDEASRTLGKVRRYGEPQAKSVLVSACRARLVSIVSELTNLESQYVEAYNRTTDPISSTAEVEVQLDQHRPGLDQSCASQVGGSASSINEKVS
jgi:hypothetical protein